MGEVATVALVVIFTIILPLVFLFVYVARQKKHTRDTQRDLSDRELLRIIASKIDGFVTAQELAKETPLTKAEASARLMSLATVGILKTSTRMMSDYHYELARPIEEVDPITLSPEPFLTANDILKLFKAYNYRLDYQNLIMATGLPLNILKREMKYFDKEDLVKSMYRQIGQGMYPYSFFLLEEPYRSNPDQFLQHQETVDLKLKEILKSDQLI